MPQIVILAPVYKYIENQVRITPYHLETGGVLFGVPVGNNRLITHAGPAGPESVHEENMYQFDLCFDQSLFDYLNRKTGIEYVGVWHKHNKSFKKPSHLDSLGAKEILKDPNYNTKGILVFPIWIMEKEPNPSNIHEWLIQRCFGTNDKIACYPYYMDLTYRFQPFNFQIANCNLRTQTDVINFYDHYIQVHQKPLSIVPQLGNRKKERISSSSKDDNFKPNGEANDNLMSKKLCISDDENRGCCQWYKTEIGQERLIEETKELQRLGGYQGLIKLENGRLRFRSSSSIISDLFLDVICKPNHPMCFPDLFLQYKHEYKKLGFEESLEDKDANKAFLNDFLKMIKTWDIEYKRYYIINMFTCLGFN